jgi:two-component system LytT family response regulator
MIKAIIIEDEPNSRELLSNMLRNYCDNVEVLGEANDVASGISLIASKRPELVFMDIEMPGGTGFDILNKTTNIPYSVIFITGYDQYAIKAIKHAALDYLLKPIDLKAAQQEPTASMQVRFLNNVFPKKEVPIEQIVLPGRNHYDILELDQIIYLEAQGNYVLFHMENNSPKLSSRSLSHYEQLLPPDLFFRIHKSYIVSLKKVIRYEKGRTGTLSMLDGNILDIAARRKSTFVQLMNNGDDKA